MNKQEFEIGALVTNIRYHDEWTMGGSMRQNKKLTVEEYDSYDDTYFLSDKNWYRSYEVVRREIINDTSGSMVKPKTEKKSETEPEPTSSKFNLNFGY
jgi:hypothetical protein